MTDAQKEQKVADFRRKICNTAIRQLTDKGAGGLSMRSIARELGYSATALYSYYRDKEEILAAVKADFFDRMAEKLEHIHSQDIEPSLKLRMGLEAYARFAEDEPAAYSLAFSPAQDNSHFPQLHVAEARFRKAFGGLIKAQLTGAPVAEDITSLTYLYWAMAHGLLAFRLAGRIEDNAPSGFDNLWLESQSLLGRGASTATGKKTSTKPENSQFSLDF